MKTSPHTEALAAGLADPDQRQAIIQRIASACSRGVAWGARRLQVPERTLWRWRLEQPDLGAAMDAARGVAKRGTE